MQVPVITAVTSNVAPDLRAIRVSDLRALGTSAYARSRLDRSTLTGLPLRHVVMPLWRWQAGARAAILGGSPFPVAVPVPPMSDEVTRILSAIEKGDAQA